MSPLFVHRWSPRAFQPDAVGPDVLDSMAEAARWAPSSYNEQPWGFHVAQRGPTRDRWNEAILPFNRTWSDRAPALVFVTARKTFAHSPLPPGTVNRHGWFDTGAATLQFILEGERHGVKSHVMGGIDTAKVHALLGLDTDVEVVAAIAVGYPGDKEVLPVALRERETPSTRRPVGDIVHFA